MTLAVIGLTGGIGCGKTTVSRLFASYGTPIIDADMVARDVVQLGTCGLNAIAEHFGQGILLSNGTLNRAKLREIIFSQCSQKQWLETLLHPLIRQNILEQINHRAANSGFQILSSPLLLETDQHLMCDSIIVIDLQKNTQIDRAMLRDNNSRRQIENIIKNQISAEERRAKADIIINNDGPLHTLEQQVEKIHRQLSTQYAAN